MLDKAVNEADLTDKQVKMVRKVADKLPKDDFKKRYGKDADNVKFGTATNIVKKKLKIDEYEGARTLVDRLLKQEKEMSKYFETKKGSLEDMVAGVTEGKQSEDYKQLFKKELEKAGKGIGAMSDQEKKDFFNNIDKKHKAKE